MNPWSNQQAIKEGRKHRQGCMVWMETHRPETRVFPLPCRRRLLGQSHAEAETETARTEGKCKESNRLGTRRMHKQTKEEEEKARARRV